MSYEKGSKTLYNLIAAYKRESFVCEKYKIFSETAFKEGFIEISNIFLKISNEEEAHAKRFKQILGKDLQDKKELFDFELYKSTTTLENLKDGLLGENDVWRGMYPQYAMEANNEGLFEVGDLFMLFADAEKNHENIFIKLYNDLRNNRYFKKNKEVKWICINCGIIIEDIEPPKQCPGCLYHKGYFKVFDTHNIYDNY